MFPAARLLLLAAHARRPAAARGFAPPARDDVGPVARARHPGRLRREPGAADGGPPPAVDGFASRSGRCARRRIRSTPGDRWKAAARAAGTGRGVGAPGARGSGAGFGSGGGRGGAVGVIPPRRAGLARVRGSSTGRQSAKYLAQQSVAVYPWIVAAADLRRNAPTDPRARPPGGGCATRSPPSRWWLPWPPAPTGPASHHCTDPTQAQDRGDGGNSLNPRLSSLIPKSPARASLGAPRPSANASRKHTAPPSTKLLARPSGQRAKTPQSSTPDQEHDHE